MVDQVVKKQKGHDAEFHTPPNSIKQKVGSGGISETRLDRADEVIDENNVDFTLQGRQFLDEFSEAVEKAKRLNKYSDQAMELMINPCMQLKANGGMFKYQLISDVADIALQFLEAVDKINDGFFKVIDAHEKTMRIIIKRKLLGDGGKEGEALVNELHKACLRYYKKYGRKEA